MKKYLAVFTGSPDSPQGKKWDSLTPDARAKAEAAGMEGWGRWVETNKISISVMGSPLGETKRVEGSGVRNVTNNLCGFTIVEADSDEAAAKLFLNHPHFAIFPGDGVEIMECLPVPGM